MNKMNQRIVTLIIAILAAGLSIYNLIISAKKLLKYDDLVSTTKNYGEYSTPRIIYTMMFILFLCISLYLIYMVFRYRGRLYDKWFRSYNIVGILNMFDVVPDFVCVILERNGRYYFQDDCYEETGKVGTLRRLQPVKRSLISKIKPFSEFDFYKYDFKSIILGDNALVGFQYNNDKIFVGNIYELASFLKNYKTNNKVLENQIKKFLKEVS